MFNSVGFCLIQLVVWFDLIQLVFWCCWRGRLDRDSTRLSWFVTSWFPVRTTILLCFHLMFNIACSWSNATLLSQAKGFSRQNPVLHWEESQVERWHAYLECKIVLVSYPHLIRLQISTYCLCCQNALHVFHSQQPANGGEKTATVWHLKCPASVPADFSKVATAFWGQLKAVVLVLKSLSF